MSNATSATPTGTFTKKHHDHAMFSASQPPSTGPSSGPSSTIRPKMVMPTGICSRGRRVRMMVCAVGIIAPPVKPWPMRPATIIGSEVEKPHITENSVKSTALPSRKLRRPKTRVSHAASGIITISDIR